MNKIGQLFTTYKNMKRLERSPWMYYSYQTYVFCRSLRKCLYNLLYLKEGNMKMPMRMVEHWMFLSNLNTILTVFRGFVLSLSYFLVSIALYRDIKKLIVSWHDFGKSILIRCQHLTNLLDNVMLTTENLGGCPNIRTTEMN